MQDLKIDGIGSIQGGEYGALAIDGIGKCTGDVTAQSITVDGLFRCTGSIRTEILDCDGMTKIQGNIHAEKIDIDGMVSVTGGTKVEATEIVCDGMIRVDGEVSADRIEADGFISAKEIVGDHISIHSRSHRFFSFCHRSHSRISLIEATTIELRGVIANTVNGKDITIGRGCRIENLDCSGTLSIARGARVKNVTGDYTMRTD